MQKFTKKNNPTSQHFVPKCYLKAFVDPTSPDKKSYLWVISKNGKNKRNQNPSKVFIKKNIYTLKLKGEKDYSIEMTLSELEGEYSSIFNDKIKKKLPLTEEEHIIICAFVSVMLQRTLRYKDNLESFILQLKNRAELNGLSVDKIKELEKYKNNIHKMAMINALTMPDITELLLKMNLAFLCSKNKKDKFITSDDPCNLFNPKLQWQKFYSPGLKQEHVELTLALSPDIMLCMSWANLRGYIDVGRKRVHESNRLIRGKCYKEFISSSPKCKKSWFRTYPLDIIFITKIIIHKFKIYYSKYKINYTHGRNKKI